MIDAELRTRTMEDRDNILWMGGLILFSILLAMGMTMWGPGCLDMGCDLCV